MLNVLLIFLIRSFFGSVSIELVGSFFLATPLVVTLFDFEVVRTEINTWKY